MRVLIAYGTKWESTTSVAKELASQIEKGGHEVQLMDLRRPRSEDLGSYDLVVVGSGIAYGSWSKGALRFLEEHSKDLSKRRLAMFACCGDILFEPDKMEELRQKYLVDVAAKFGLDPISMGLFGGVLDFDRYSFLVKGIMNMKHAGKKDMMERGVDPSKPYDFRDWERIRRWGTEIGEVI